MSRFANYALAFPYLLLALSVALPSDAMAHPFHVTIAEAELNAKTGHLEVSLKLNPIDLEALLRKRANKRIHLEKTKDVDRQIVQYLDEVFQVRRRDGRRCKLRWVGKEVEVKHAWLYFEFDVAGQLDGATIDNRVFVNLLPKQQNTIVLTSGKRKSTLQFTRDKSRRQVALPALTDEVSSPRGDR